MNGFGKIVLVAVALGVGSNARAVTLDFEEGTAGASVVNQAGATFGGAFYAQCGGGCPAPDFGLFISGASGAAPFTVTFAMLQSSVGFTNVSFSSVLAEAFDVDGALVDTLAIDTQGFDGNVNFLSGSGIASVTFSFNNGSGLGGIGIDDLTFSAVPEPASWAMMIAGFGLVGFAARRRRVALAA